METETGVKISDLCHRQWISQQIFYRWKSRYWRIRGYRDEESGQLTVSVSYVLDDMQSGSTIGQMIAS